MSYLFNASSDIITFPDAAVLDSTGTWTLSYWANLTATGAAMVPVSKEGNYSAYFDYGDAQRIASVNYKAASAGVHKQKSTTTVSMASFVGVWRHVAHRASADVMQSVWIDGIDRTADLEEYWFAGTRDLTGLLCIGNTSALGAPLLGYVAEISIWNNLAIADARVGDLAGGLSPVDLSTPPDWYLRLKANAVEHYSSAAGTVSGATLDAEHPTVTDPAGGGGGPVMRNSVSAVI